jgi:serine/threonine-protein kinase 24/25/MST4
LKVDLGSLGKRPNDTSIPYWLPPECIVKQAFGPEADIWSVGMLALEMAGIQVVANTFTKTVFEISTRGAPELNGDWSHAFRDFLRLCLQMDPHNRPSAAELFEVTQHI